MIKDLLETFRKPSAKELAQRELEDAQRALLLAHSAAEYAASMAKYHTERIQRLSAYVKETA